MPCPPRATRYGKPGYDDLELKFEPSHGDVKNIKIKGGKVTAENELVYDMQPTTSDDSKSYSIKGTATSKLTKLSHSFTVSFTYKKVISWTNAQQSGQSAGRVSTPAIVQLIC